MKTIRIKTPYITLGQLLKYADVVQSGGETKAFLAENEILVNNTIENRRGKKIHPGDKVSINKKIELLITD
jgi:S4 domain protein YaaA